MLRKLLLASCSTFVITSCAPTSQQCVAMNNSICIQVANPSKPSPTTIPSVSPSPSIPVAPKKPKTSAQSETSPNPVIASLSKNSYKNHDAIIRFVNTDEGLAYQKYEKYKGLFTTDTCDINEHKRIVLSCSKGNIIRKIIVDPDNLNQIQINVYHSQNIHVIRNSVLAHKIREGTN
jgi:hypothetical protein